MFAVARKPGPEAAQSTAPRPASRHAARVPPPNPVWMRLAMSSGAGTREPVISAASDPAEQEADRLADAAVDGASPGGPLLRADPGIQRKCAACAAGGTCPACEEEGAPQVQRKAEPGAASPSPQRSLEPSGAGAPIPGDVRSPLEASMGFDFGHVRVHSGSEAAEAARSIHARAYTLGHHVVMSRGAPPFDSREGRRLLAHELVHVAQQGAARPLVSGGLRPGIGLGGAGQATVATSVPTGRIQCDRDLAQIDAEIAETELRAANTKDAAELKALQAQRDALLAERAKVQKATPAPTPAPKCTTTFAKATSFKDMIALVRAAEARLAAKGITTPKDQIHALRGIYYGTTWSHDYLVEKSATRNEGFQRFTRPSMAPATSVPVDVQPMLDCGLFKALQDSQDLVDASGRHVDFGHLIIGLDARFDPSASSNIKYPAPGPLGITIDIDLGGTGTELVTWIGDLGGGAASLAIKRVSAPSTSASAVFKGTDYGGSINLEGDIAGYAVASSTSATAVAAPTFATGKGLADALDDYLSPAGAGASWKARATTFLKMNGGTFDPAGALTNRATLITNFGTKIQEFACNYLASRVKDKHVTVADAKKAAASHIVAAATEVATTFVDALVDSHKGGGTKIEAKTFPTPAVSTTSACTIQITAASVLSGSSP